VVGLFVGCVWKDGFGVLRCVGCGGWVFVVCCMVVCVVVVVVLCGGCCCVRVG
jgi:hypothetical protein